MKIYIVTSGCYSDYTIDGVFLDKDKAQKYVDVRYDSTIEEYETDDDNLEAMIDDEMHYSNNSHEIIEVILKNNMFTNIDDEPKIRFGAEKNVTNGYSIEYSYEFLWYMKEIKYNIADHDKIKERAIKAAYDLRAFARSLKAEGYTEEKINEIINNKED